MFYVTNIHAFKDGDRFLNSDNVKYIAKQILVWLIDLHTTIQADVYSGVFLCLKNEKTNNLLLTIKDLINRCTYFSCLPKSFELCKNKHYTYNEYVYNEWDIVVDRMSELSNTHIFRINENGKWYGFYPK